MLKQLAVFTLMIAMIGCSSIPRKTNTLIMDKPVLKRHEPIVVSMSHSYPRATQAQIGGGGIFGQPSNNLACTGTDNRYVLFDGTDDCEAGLLSDDGTNVWLDDDTASFGLGNANDVRLYRDDANALGLRNGSSAQEFNIYNSYTSSTVYEKLEIFYSGDDLNIRTNKGGSGGSATDINIGPGNPTAVLRFVTNNTYRWSVDASGHFTALGSYNIGDGAGNSPVDIYAEGYHYKSVTAGITASVTQTQGQGALTTEVNEVSTVANANDTVTLDGAAAGKPQYVINNGANTLQIFPASGDNLGNGVDTAMTLASGDKIMFLAYDATNWEQF